jgi:hypothetical protein
MVEDRLHKFRALEILGLDESLFNERHERPLYETHHFAKKLLGHKNNFPESQPRKAFIHIELECLHSIITLSMP